MMSIVTWTPKRIQQLRKLCGENTATFGRRLLRSGRTIEEWEQGRSTPDALVQLELGRIEARYLRRATRA